MSWRASIVPGIRSVIAWAFSAPMLRGMAVIGGEGYAHQAAAIQRCNPHFVVATPGRLLSQCGHSKSAEPLVGTAAEATPDAAVCTLSAIETLILQASDRGTRVIMVSHDVAQARRIAAHIVLMRGGRVLEQAPAPQFFAGPKSKAARQFLAGGLLF